MKPPANGCGEFEALENQWDHLAGDDALWAILTRSGRKPGEWTAREFFSLGEAEIAAFVERLANLGLPAAFENALDFGCGVGRLTRALAGIAARATGVDVAPGMVEQARRLNRDVTNCSFVLNGRPDLSAFPDASFDLVYSNIVLQHMHPRFSCAYIREFARLLVPGGIAAFQIPECPANTPVGLAMRVVPVPLLRPLRRMDMYGVPRAKVESILESGGLRLASACPDQAAGPNWKSYFYIAVKAAS